MGVRVSENEGNFTPAPAGFHPAVCCDIVDAGMVDGAFGPKHKVDLWWQIAQVNPETGKRFAVRRRYTAGLGGGSKPTDLRRDLEAWRGRPFSKEEARGFDLDVLLGKNCQLNLVQQIKDGNTYANVTLVAPPLKGAAPMVVTDYVRKADQAKANGQGAAASGDQDPDDETTF